MSSDNMAISESIEKHNFKISIGVAVTAIIFLIVISAQFIRWQVETEATLREFDDRITHVGEKVVSMRSEIAELSDRANERDVQLATINTKLANIEALLITIRSDIKEITHEQG